jgi:sugar lactone lactonase YvrE
MNAQNLSLATFMTMPFKCIRRVEFLKHGVAVLALVALASCGGGNSGGNSDGNSGTPSNPTPPVTIDLRQALPAPPATRLAPGLTVLTGDIGGAGTLDGQGTEARFYTPVSLAMDRADNLYVADDRYGGPVLRKVTPAGLVTTVAGPTSRSNAFDSAGNRYLIAGASIVRITPDGNATTLAGVADQPGWTDGSPAAARFYGPGSIALDQSGNLYVLDSKVSCAETRPYTCTFQGGAIRKVSPAGTVTTLAGYIGEGSRQEFVDGTGAAARFSDLVGMAIDPSGNLFVLDGGRIRKITPAGVVTTLAEDAAQPSGFIPTDIAAGRSGELYVVGGNLVRRVQPDGSGSAFAELPHSIGGPGPIPKRSITIDSMGNLYVANGDDSTILKVTPAGQATTFAGLAPVNFDRTGRKVTAIGQSDSMAADLNGNLYVTQYGGIMKVAPDGMMTSLVSASNLRYTDKYGQASTLYTSLTGIAVSMQGVVYVTDSWHVFRLESTGMLTTIAGNGEFQYIDATGTAAAFSSIRSMVMDRAGNFYVAESHAVRKVTPAGVTTTIAGSSTPGYSDGLGTAAQFNLPSGIAIDGNGNLLVADTGNRTIRKITPDGRVTTVAGIPGTAPGLIDGVGSTARFTRPEDMAVDTEGAIYVLDASTVRKVTPDGAVTTVAGSPAYDGIRTGALPGNFTNWPRSGPTALVYLGANVFAIRDDTTVLKLAVP